MNNVKSSPPPSVVVNGVPFVPASHTLSASGHTLFDETRIRKLATLYVRLTSDLTSWYVNHPGHTGGHNPADAPLAWKLHNASRGSHATDVDRRDAMNQVLTSGSVSEQLTTAEANAMHQLMVQYASLAVLAPYNADGNQAPGALVW